MKFIVSSPPASRWYFQTENNWFSIIQYLRNKIQPKLVTTEFKLRCVENVGVAPHASAATGRSAMSIALAPATLAETPTAGAAISTGLIGLAVAMGIGRFAFTPLLPLMVQDSGVSLVQGSWLATANYVGYLVGALMCISSPPAPPRAIRWGLVSIAFFTLGMGLTAELRLWLALRFLAGAGSAFVLVGVSAWVMPILAQLHQATRSGQVFAGVGVGICFAGLVALVAGVTASGSQATWISLGVIAALFALALWRQLTGGGVHATAVVGHAPLTRQAWTAALCYGAFGYGYIIPATFLPALAREAIKDPAVFGWVWPIFGAAAAVSTVLAVRLLPALSSRRLWAYGQWLLALGVVAPVFAINLTTLSFAALCVGGTFMVITMAGIQEARRLGGARVVALCTAAFAFGQIVGPLTVSLFDGRLLLPSLLAALALAASSLTLGLTAPASMLSETTPGPRRPS
ncbi:YbfB/YjiJ family MFS transporter [Bradyrhizobium sp.]|uniref:YbfB/YjiJ family MFS transporter n=1 Tax=Bradyrhizobium sp. TaxID=376 RepID=UPI002E053280|nr:YbfB/YjiJ family MFS transporter [Bradyrhizobium sp.]